MKCGLSSGLCIPPLTRVPSPSKQKMLLVFAAEKQTRLVHDAKDLVCLSFLTSTMVNIMSMRTMNVSGASRSGTLKVLVIAGTA